MPIVRLIFISMSEIEDIADTEIHERLEQVQIGERDVQWNIRIKDTLGTELLSSFRRLSFGGRFDPTCNLYQGRIQGGSWRSQDPPLGLLNRHFIH